MFSRRILVSAVAVFAAAVAIVPGAVPAYALTTVAVTAGSAPSGTSVAFQLSSSGTFAFKDLTTNATSGCMSSNVGGTARAGANSPSNVAKINGGAGAVNIMCSWLGLPFTMAGVGTNTWVIAATANSTSGTTPINITGINVFADSTSCSFNISGSAAGSLVNGNPSKIIIPAVTATTSNLVVSNYKLKNGATKCMGGAVTNTTPGNKISLSGMYNVTATNNAYNPVTAIAS